MHGILSISDLESRLTAPQSSFALSLSAGIGSSRSFTKLPASLNVLYKRASRLGTLGFFIEHGQQYSYGDIFSRARLMALGLGRYGVQAGDLVALSIESRAVWIQAFIAVTAIGACAILTDDASETVLHDLCKNTVGANLFAIFDSTISLSCALFANSDTGFKKLASLQELYLVDDGNDIFQFSHQANTRAIIALTSGSTGERKGVAQSHKGILTGLLNTFLAGAIANAVADYQPRGSARPTIVVTSPLPYIGGYGALLCAMFTGSQLVFAAPGASLVEIARQSNATAIGTLSHFELAQIVDQIETLPSLRSLSFNGSFPHRRTLSEILRRRPDLRLSLSYGLTEANGVIASRLGDNADISQTISQGECGCIVPSVEYAIRRLPKYPQLPNMSGELLLRGDMLPLSFSDGSPIADGEGWLHTGDVGYVDERHRLHILGRLAELRIVRDQCIFPSALEAIIQGVICSDCAALSYQLGEAEVLAIFVSDRLSEEQKREILRIVTTQFPYSKSDVFFVLLSSLPRTRSGKVDRLALARYTDTDRLALSRESQG